MPKPLRARPDMGATQVRGSLGQMPHPVLAPAPDNEETRPSPPPPPRAPPAKPLHPPRAAARPEVRSPLPLTSGSTRAAAPPPRPRLASLPTLSPADIAPRG